MNSDSSKFEPKHDPTALPAGLPVPVDDGVCDHLGRPPFDVLPDIVLPATDGNVVRLRAASERPLVLFFYPRTGIPGEPPDMGFHGENWDSIPGARGCTPQSCGFRDFFGEFARLGVTVFGVSTNSIAHQREFKARMHMPFEFLSDFELLLVRQLRLPTFEWPLPDGEQRTLVRRMSMVLTPGVDGLGRIAKVWYPVFPPNENASSVLAWLDARTNARSKVGSA